MGGFFKTILLPALVVSVLSSQQSSGAETGVDLWLTDPTGTARFEKQQSAPVFGHVADGKPVIAIDSSKTRQEIDGFGASLTGGSALHIVRMKASARTALLNELFGTDGTQIGISYLRVSIGASDLNERVYSYDDLPPGRTDPEMARFSLAPDQRDVIPVLKEILQIAPDVKIMVNPT
jgi:glucosylceramidase